MRRQLWFLMCLVVGACGQVGDDLDAVTAQGVDKVNSTIIGYDKTAKRVYIGDPANFGGHALYWLSFDQLATSIPPKGYSA